MTGKNARVGFLSVVALFFRTLLEPRLHIPDVLVTGCVLDVDATPILSGNAGLKR